MFDCWTLKIGSSLEAFEVIDDLFGAGCRSSKFENVEDIYCLAVDCPFSSSKSYEVFFCKYKREIHFHFRVRIFLQRSRLQTIRMGKHSRRNFFFNTQKQK